MRLSLSELDALSRKAMRGAGAEWGLAEEAGKAAAWLAARGLPGGDALAQLLQAWPGEAITGTLTTGWMAPGGRLCPIRAGSVLSDHAALAPETGLRLTNVAMPVLLLPFVQRSGMRLAGDPGPLFSMAEAVLKEAIFFPGDPLDPPLLETLPSISSDTVSTLEAWAHRTYVPASDASRHAGAGAGVTDND